MAILSVKQSYSVTIDGQVYTGGSETAETITVAGETIFDRTYSIDSSTTVQTEVFRAGSAATDDIADWEFLFFLSDQDAHIRIVKDETSGTPATDGHGLVIALRAGVPFMWTGGDVSKGATAGTVDADLASTGWADDAAGVLNAVEYNQQSGATAKLRVVAIR